MRDDYKTILFGIFQFLFGAAVSFGAVALYRFSYFHKLPYESWIEIGQELFLLIGLCLMSHSASRSKTKAGGLWLVAGFLTALFIRELDAWFDDIFHGAWKYILLAYLVWLSFKIAKAGRQTIVPGLAYFIRSRAFPLMLVGTVIILAYSRLYGFKGLWALYAGNCSWNDVKTLSEEATELVGYALIFYSTWIFHRLPGNEEWIGFGDGC